MTSLQDAVIAVFVMAAVILASRALPFLLFSRRKAPAALSFVERYMPPVAMTVLAASSFATIRWVEFPYGGPEVVAGIAVALVHLWKRNALISIFGGTGLYLLLRFLLKN